MYRKGSGKFIDNRVNDKVNDKVNDLLAILTNHPEYTVTQLADVSGVSRKTIAARLKELKGKGYWKINDLKESWNQK